MITVSTAEFSGKNAALELLFEELHESERAASIQELLHVVEKNDLSLDGLLVAEFDDQVVGAGLYLLQQDRTAHVWFPVVTGYVPASEVYDAILSEIRQRIVAEGAWLGQCLIEPEKTVQRETLIRNGFGHLADLRYLCRALKDPLPEPPSISFDVHSYEPSSAESHRRFVTLLEQTYSGTLDCPGLNGLRSAEDMLDSHRLAGEFHSTLWKIYSVDSEDVGVLLFSSHSEQNAWEVAYVGVSPAYRGKGYSRAMLLCGLAEAFEQDCDSVFLAVDAQNHYAGKVYSDLGFEELAVRSVHVHSGKQPSFGK